MSNPFSPKVNKRLRQENLLNILIFSEPLCLLKSLAVSYSASAVAQGLFFSQLRNPFLPVGVDILNWVTKDRAPEGVKP